MLSNSWKRWSEAGVRSDDGDLSGAQSELVRVVFELTQACGIRLGCKADSDHTTTHVPDRDDVVAGTKEQACWWMMWRYG